MEKLLKNVGQMLSNPPGNVFFLDAKKRGRPKKDEDLKITKPAALKRKLAVSEDETNKEVKTGESKSKSAKKKAAKVIPTTTDKDLAASHPGNDFQQLIAWIKNYENEPKVESSSDWVPAYQFCKLYSCFWCQEFSWDLKRCSSCKRMVPTGSKFLSVENSETVDADVDKKRPFFHAPPIPYFQSGTVVFCTSCFYFTDATLSECTFCGSKINARACHFAVEFMFSNCVDPPEMSLVHDFVPRKIDDSLIECPHCFLSSTADSLSCVHCNKDIPVQVLISRVGNIKSADEIFKMDWPLKSEILSGSIKTMPPKYVPVYKENMLATCPWCSALVFDLFRCSTCARQLPKLKNLVPIQEGSMYGITCGPSKPAYDPIPVPNYKPGKMCMCHECKNYSRNLRMCDTCGKRQRNYEAVFLDFKTTKLSKNNSKESLVSFTPRMVNKKLFVCPQCELSTDNRKCTHCGLIIPQTIRVVQLSHATARKGRNLQGKIIMGSFKKDSLVREDPLINTGSITKSQIKDGFAVLPNNYVPRYREKGFVQCTNCSTWSRDFDRCSTCYNRINTTSAIVIFPKQQFSHPVVKEFSGPKVHTPAPYLKLGIQTMCPSCLCFVSGPPFCTECNQPIDENCVYYKVEAKMIKDDKSVKFHPRTLSDKSMAFCPFCGFTSEDFKKCSICSKPFPKSCSVTPVDGHSDLPPGLILSCPKKAKEQLTKEPIEEQEETEVELIKIEDWKAAVGLKESNEVGKWLETIPFAVKLDTFYDDQLSCFPDEIFQNN